MSRPLMAVWRACNPLRGAVTAAVLTASPMVAQQAPRDAPVQNAQRLSQPDSSRFTSFANRVSAWGFRRIPCSTRAKPRILRYGRGTSPMTVEGTGSRPRCAGRSRAAFAPLGGRTGHLGGCPILQYRSLRTSVARQLHGIAKPHAAVGCHADIAHLIRLHAPSYVEHDAGRGKSRDELAHLPGANYEASRALAGRPRYTKHVAHLSDGATRRLVACSKANASAISRGSLHAPPAKLTPAGVICASKPCGNAGVGAFGTRPNGTITVG